jgi:hypothetical protein
MTLQYGFYDSLNNDRLYNSEQMSRLFEGIITDGIFQSVGQGFVVSPNSGMLINVGTGRAWIKNTWSYNDANVVLAVDTSEPVLNRIDTVVIEVNKDLGVRANSLKIIKGTPASSPVQPTLSDTATLTQKPLANIYVGAGVTAINAGNITNRIAVAGGTPFITGVLTSFDVATLFGQFESNFQAWFTNLQNQLDANQASNLQNQINDLYIQNTKGWITPAGSWTYASATTINVPTDATLTMHKGMKIRLKQGGAFKYFVAKSVTATLLTIISSTSHVLTNAAITDIGISLDNPHDFPEKFNFAITPTPSIGSFGSAAVVNQSEWIPITPGLLKLEVQFSIPNNGSGSGTVQFGAPTTLTSTSTGYGRENATSGAMLQGYSSGSNIVIFNYANGYPAASGSVIYFNIFVTY